MTDVKQPQDEQDQATQDSSKRALCWQTAHVLTSIAIIALVIGMIYGFLQYVEPKGPTVLFDVSWEDTRDPHTAWLHVYPSIEFVNKEDSEAKPSGGIQITPMLRTPKELDVIVTPLTLSAPIFEGESSDFSFLIQGKNPKQEYFDGIAAKVFVSQDDAYEFYYSPSVKPLTNWRGRSVFFWLKIGLVALILAKLIVFTGDLTRGKMRMLFLIMYLMTFLSIVAPSSIALLLHYHPSLAREMHDSAIGLVKGTTKGTQEAQWLLNVGGLVNAPSSTMNPASMGPEDISVNGGVVVPFYVVWLAMIGAGINMTRKVPGHQKIYVQKCYRDAGERSSVTKGDLVKQFLKKLDPLNGEGFDTREHAESAAEIRSRLINNYMYLLSAPFLGITVYYLLRVMGTNVNKEVLVIMSFFAGLKSDNIIQAITRFGGNVLTGSGERRSRAEDELESPSHAEKPHRTRWASLKRRERRRDSSAS